MVFARDEPRSQTSDNGKLVIVFSASVGAHAQVSAVKVLV